MCPAFAFTWAWNECRLPSTNKPCPSTPQRKLRNRRAALGLGALRKTPTGVRDQRRAFGRMDDLDRLTLFLELQQDRVGAVDLHGALAERELLRRVARRLSLHDPLPRERLQIGPAELLRHRERRGENRAAIGGMALNHPAPPFWIEQVGEASRRVGALDEVCVVADGAERRTRRHEQAVRIDGLRRKVSRHVFRHMRREPAAAFPGDEMGRVGAQHHVDRLDAACLLLSDALEDALRARPLDPRDNSRIGRLERLGEFLRQRDVERRIERDLALPARGLDQGGADRGRRRGGGLDGFGEDSAGGQRHRCLENVASRMSPHDDVRRSARFYFARSSVKNLSPYAKRFGFRKNPRMTAPLGATASCWLPPGRQQNWPGPQTPS